MPEYRRWRERGATYFFTLVTAERSPIFAAEADIALLRGAFAETQRAHPFSIDAIVVLPDHLHALWSLPRLDDDFSSRWRLIKTRFTRAYLAAGGREAARGQSRARHAERGVWQRRFWEHLIRDEEDLRRHVEYIHYNAVKHGHATCPHAWPWSSFRQWVDAGVYDLDWACCCPCQSGSARRIVVPDVAAGE